MLKIYNSLSKEKENFKPIRDPYVNLYVCGMTVYDYCHIGHARVLVMFDIIVRHLRHLGYKVKYVRNITDIDDKIIKRANENNEDYRALTERFIKAMHDDEKALEILPPDEEPRATNYIPAMVKFVQTLITKQYAYIAENGDVYYDVDKFKKYGCLSHQNLEKLRAGARVAVVDGSKQDPLDFVLWKLAKPGEPSWDSPWGLGRPGWHLECSVMSMECLGEHFDIHGGGFDLTFPHHENEIAQSEAVTEKSFVNIWMHTGFLQLDKEKMSKSLGNILSIREMLAICPPEVLRFFLMSAHYRSPLNYSIEALESARLALERFYLALRNLSNEEKESNTEFERRFFDAMNDDFNTPDAIAVLFDLVREINQNATSLIGLRALLRYLGSFLGILQHDPDDFLQLAPKGISKEEINEFIKTRDEARISGNYSKADQIRNHLLSLNIILEDSSKGTVWRSSISLLDKN